MHNQPPKSPTPLIRGERQEEGEDPLLPSPLVRGVAGGLRKLRVGRSCPFREPGLVNVYLFLVFTIYCIVIPHPHSHLKVPTKRQKKTPLTERTWGVVIQITIFSLDAILSVQSGHRRSVLYPRLCPLKCPRRSQHCLLIPLPPHNVETDGQTIRGETRGYGSSGVPNYINR